MKVEDILDALEQRQMSPEEAKKWLKQLQHPQECDSAGTRYEDNAPLGERNPTKPDREVIAIIGMSGRYPGANDLDAYWENLIEGVHSIQEIPKSRWNTDTYFQSDPQKGKIYAKWLGMLDHIDEFDPLFFHISPQEAEHMDPQQRIFMQEGYSAFEDAGYTPHQLNGKNCGIYLGIMSEEYGSILREGLASRSHIRFNHTLGSSHAIAAARLSYYLNLKGPAIPVDTACSSSLVSVHLACQALLSGEIDMALAGGVTLYLIPDTYLSMCDAGMLSPDGQCKAFDNSANGFVPGEGAGAIVLKRLKDAEKDGDHIYGTIIASAINQDGKTNGITAPSQHSQMELERHIYDKFNIDPKSISYVEMHGTGTKLGDPIELQALASVYDDKTSTHPKCAIGSVKSNIGHTSAAAGIAGIHKVAYCMRYKKLVPTLHFKEPNEHFALDHSAFYVNTEYKHWETADSPRRAAVSSFGFSGTNAHLIMEEYVDQRPVIKHTGSLIFVLSAESQEQVYQYAQSLLRWLALEDQAELADIACSLQLGREAYRVRLALIASSRDALLSTLKQYLNNENSSRSWVTGEVQSAPHGDVYTPEVREEVAILLHGLLKEKKAKPIADLWVQGFQVDWSSWYGEAMPRRISLPTYPFAKEKYWLTNAKSELPANSWVLLQKHWEPTDPSIPLNPFTDLGEVVILASKETQPLAKKIASQLLGSRVLYLEHSMDDDRQEWNSLISCTKFIDLIGCGTQRFDEWSWIPCLQRWIEQSSQEKYEIKFLCVTRGLENNRSQVNVSGASRVGLYRMLQSEYRYTHSRHIDIDINEDDYTLIEYIKAELNMESMDTEVRYAKGIRYRACLKEQEKNEELQCVRMSFSPDHVLWITGGTRGIGALCAEHFVKNYGVRRIVLMGKESIPPRHKWKSHLEDYGSSLGIKIEKILSLEGMGAQVKTLSVSLGDVEGLHQSVQHVTSEWGPIGGVLHCAGMESSDTPAFIRKSLTSIQEVALPKVEGLNHLYACLKDEPLRFFVLFSSVSATIPTLAAGQSDYAMANAYMDYFAQDQAAVTPIVSIQWPNWKDTGMGEVKSKAYKDTGLLSHTNEQGLQMLDYILSQGMGPVVLPAYIDRDNWAVERLMQSNKPQDQNSDASNFPAQNQSSKENENLSNIVRGLTRIFAQELKLDTHKIQPYVPFAHYGVDSILLAQVVKVIRQKSGVDLDPSLLFEYPTVDALAIYLQNNFPSSMDSLYLFGTSVMQPNTADEQKETEETYLVNTHDFGTLSEIAIIGMSCHFPEAPSLEKYWELLTKGESSIGQIPSEHSGEDGELFFAGVIDRTPTVASTYFQISTEDAAAMDPQALLLLEESLKTVYHAGYTPEELHEKSVGVYIGARSRHLPQEELLLAAKNPILAVGANYLASNISRFLDVKGPSLVIDSACSSALISMNLAIQALRNGDIEYALVGGINLFHTDKEHQLFKQRGLLSQDSEFHIFDRRSQGVILAEGAGMVLLKSKEQAQKDGDSILAVIKSVAVNNDGRTAGPSAPSYKGQCDVMRRALELSGKQPQEIDYIEANGSGSQVSDVLELKAIQAVYRTKSKLPLGIGSVKPNIGHSLCAEGMASLIKLILMLSHGQKVPFLSGQQPMKHFKIEDSALYFNRTSEKWSSPRVAGVSSFADGGTNAHLILESYEEDSRTTIRRSLPLPSDLFELPKATSDRKGNRRMVWESFGLEG